MAGVGGTSVGEETLMVGFRRFEGPCKGDWMGYGRSRGRKGWFIEAEVRRPLCRRASLYTE